VIVDLEGTASLMASYAIAIVGDAPPRNFIDIDRALSKIRSVAPDLSNSRKFQKLMT
jgi:hypothetical protein